jgi:hypothetical protein
MPDPNFWGPAMWTTLHNITFNYPENPTDEQKMQHKQFFMSLKNVLPCETCREHYGKNIEKIFPIDAALKNRDTFSRWLVDLHNSVNRRLNKPVIPYETVKEKYDAMNKKCTSCDINVQCNNNTTTRRKTNNLLYIVILLLIVIIALTLYYLPRIKH